MIGRFKPMTSVMQIGVGQFALPGNNAGFCNAILQKNAASAALRLESLTYVRPTDREPLAAVSQQPVVVNLLMQLRAYYDQSNTFLRNQTALNLQLTNQLRQVLASSNGTVRLRAGEIERAVRENLYRDGEFKRAVDSLARELKKNENRPSGLTVWQPATDPAAGTNGRPASAPARGTAAGPRQQETPDSRVSLLPVVRLPGLSLEQGEPRPERDHAERKTLHTETPLQGTTIRRSAFEQSRRGADHGTHTNLTEKRSGTKKNRGKTKDKSSPGLQAGQERSGKEKRITPAHTRTTKPAPESPQVPIEQGRSGPPSVGRRVDKQQVPVIWRQIYIGAGQTERSSLAASTGSLPQPAFGIRLSGIIPVGMKNISVLKNTRIWNGFQITPASSFQRSLIWRQGLENGETPLGGVQDTTAAGRFVGMAALPEGRESMPAEGRILSETPHMPEKQGISAREAAVGLTADRMQPPVLWRRIAAREKAFLDSTTMAFAADVPGIQIGERSKRFPGEDSQMLREKVSLFSDAGRIGMSTPGPDVGKPVRLPGNEPRMRTLPEVWRTGRKRERRFAAAAGKLRLQLNYKLATAGQKEQVRYEPFLESKSFQLYWQPLSLAASQETLEKSILPIRFRLSALQTDFPFHQTKGTSDKEAGSQMLIALGQTAVKEGWSLPTRLLQKAVIAQKERHGAKSSAVPPVTGSLFTKGREMDYRSVLGSAKKMLLFAHQDLGMWERLTLQQKAARLGADAMGKGMTGMPLISAALQPAPQQEKLPDMDGGMPMHAGKLDRQPVQRTMQSGMIHRHREHNGDAPPTENAVENSGEAVLQAQVITPARRAVASSTHIGPAGIQKTSPASDTPLTKEQEDYITRRILEDFNYNRMAAEVLDRVERRLRAERRKFGR